MDRDPQWIVDPRWDVDPLAPLPDERFTDALAAWAPDPPTDLPAARVTAPPAPPPVVVPDVATGPPARRNVPPPVTGRAGLPTAATTPRPGATATPGRPAARVTWPVGPARSRARRWAPPATMGVAARERLARARAAARRGGPPGPRTGTVLRRVRRVIAPGQPRSPRSARTFSGGNLTAALGVCAVVILPPAGLLIGLLLTFGARHPGQQTAGGRIATAGALFTVLFVVLDIPGW